MDLRGYKLGDLGNICMCKRIIKSETNEEGGVPFFKIGTFGGNADVYISKEQYYDYRSRFSYPKKGDVLISAAGTIGRVVIYNGEEAYYQDSNIVWIDNDESIIRNDFLYYALKTVKWNPSKGSTILRLYNDDIRNTRIVIPADLEVQREIASFLRNLDRKISLNRSINAELERMAKEIYDYWFVQFEFPDEHGRPYKSSGGAMVYNPVLKREVPQGWEVVNINHISRICRGVTYKPTDLQEKGVLILRGNNIENNHIVFDNNTAYLPEHMISDMQKIRRHDIIITMSSGSKEHIGKCAMFQNDSIHSFGAFLSKITPDSNCPFFMFLFLISSFFKKKIKSICNGTGINNLTNQTFDEVFFAFPDSRVLTNFESKMQSVFDEIGNNENEIVRLTTLRDELLPLLMTGQVEVRGMMEGVISEYET